LLKVHRSYLKPITKLRKLDVLKGAAHITGGGLTDNLPRMLPPGCSAEVAIGSWPVLPIFDLMRQIGNLEEDDYRRSFNLGIGMVFAVGRKNAPKAEAALRKAGETPYVIGRVKEARDGEPPVVYV
ncbi:MAG TPA: AIR synthase-related protein, partial [Bryobacteraceae bacterium]|nr:AIR synthase-related protein [Bryobacteraceae bacterium]